MITVSEIKDFLYITDTGQDTWLTTQITNVQAEIEGYCRAEFDSTDRSEILDGDGSRRLYLRHYPVIQLSIAASPADADILASLQYRGTPDDAWADIEDDVDFIFTDSAWSYVEFYSAIFPFGVKNIKAVYKSGYTTIPADLKLVATEMVAMLWKKSNRSGIALLGESSKTTSGIATTTTRQLLDMDPKWKRVLNRYRRLV